MKQKLVVPIAQDRVADRALAGSVPIRRVPGHAVDAPEQAPHRQLGCVHGEFVGPVPRTSQVG